MTRALLNLFILFSSLNIAAQNTSKFCKQIGALDQLIKDHHYSPKPINDTLSSHVYKLFLKGIDPNKRYLTQTDVKLFKEDLYQLDNYIIDSDCAFIDKYARILRERITSSIDIVRNLLTEELDYSGKERLNFTDKENFKYFESKDKIEQYWRKRVSYDVILEIIDTDTTYTAIASNFKEEEAIVKKKVIEKELCQLEEDLGREKDIETKVKEAFLNALANYQDPNSMFFNPTEKFLFDASVANNQLSFGIHTDKNDAGNIVIVHIVSGSPAHKHGGFEVNDIIKSLKSGDDILETYCVSNDQIQEFTSHKDHKKVAFRIKKKNGVLKTIELTKEKIPVEENQVKGYIIGDALDIGYINIPSFYSDSESSNGLGLANDVAKELNKLQKEKIKALVLDLRFNGGGSMKEATDLSGMFINKGPVSILKYKTGEVFTIKDGNRGLLFNKPILILVSNFSASASEYFASVMQDYNRAIVVGSPTHGKSTAQTVLPLSRTQNLGYGKITVEKFYRVNGRSVQSRGVIPDIILPNFYDNFKTEESHMQYAYKNDTIPVVVMHKPLTSFNLSYASTKSKERVKSSKAFNALNDLNTLVLNDYINKTTDYPLTLQDVYNDINTSKTKWKSLSDILEKNNTSISVRNLKTREELLKYYEDEKEANALIIKELKDDIFIEEAYNILIDFISPGKSN